MLERRQRLRALRGVLLDELAVLVEEERAPVEAVQEAVAVAERDVAARLDVGLEAVIAADPQAIITAEPGGNPSEALSLWQRFPTLSATRHGQLYTLNADRMNRHGPRLPEEIEVLCAAIERTRRVGIK